MSIAGIIIALLLFAGTVLWFVSEIKNAPFEDEGDEGRGQ